MVLDQQLEAYFSSIEKYVSRAYNLANLARKQGKDPEPFVDIPVAEDLAARVEGLISTMFSQLLNSGLKEGIRALESTYGKNDERVALLIGKDVALERYVKFGSTEKAAEAGLRVAVAYLTLGIVTAPLEGISNVKLKKNFDKTEYLAVYFAGPIRSAGGTASAITVIAADFIRKSLGIGSYKPTDVEINRYFTEVEDYYTRITPKQYHPTKEEIAFIIKNIPVEITGDPTEELEVSNFKDLERIETNRIRGGMCLVLLDGLPLKAEKVLKRIKKYPKEYDLGNWMWLEKFIELKHQIHAEKKMFFEETARYSPSAKYITKVLGGRPIISYPASKGGFALRYGRSRTGGLASTAMHPATMFITEFLAIGTQAAIELPGKATVCTPCDSIEGPTVKLKDGSVIKIHDSATAIKIKNDVKEILFLGDLLVPYGEFLSNNHVLLPAKYCPEWWALEVKQNILNLPNLPNEPLKTFIEKPFPTPSVEKVFQISKELKVPLHPEYTFLWNDLTIADIKKLVIAFAEAEILHSDENTIQKITLPQNIEVKLLLEKLLAEHTLSEEKIILAGCSIAAYVSLGKPSKDNYGQILQQVDGCKNALEAISKISGVVHKNKIPTYVGLKMGRPEKAERRLLKGRPQVLFPCGYEGGRMRNMMEAYKKNFIVSATQAFLCQKCKTETPFPRCHICNNQTEHQIFCKVCSKRVNLKQHCNAETVSYKRWRINLKELLDKAFENIGAGNRPELFKGVRGVFGKDRSVECLEKGILRTKYDLYVNKDGTVRYDSSDVPLTHFKPKEAGVTAEQLVRLGYQTDVVGNKLETDEQLVELFPQDIIISDNSDFSGSGYLIKAAQFIDDLLVKFYKLQPFYNIKTKEDLLGSLVIGLAPHTSAGIVGRIIGFTPAKIGLAHPLWHAGKRRNCDGDEDSIMLLMDALLNFSRSFLPDTRGGRTMDAPLVLTIKLDPEEVDDESWNVDVSGNYPLEFFEQTQTYPMPFELKIKPKTIQNLIGKPEVFHIQCTHDTSDINDGPFKTKYVELESMTEKVWAQLEIAKKIKAVDEHKVAEAVIMKHFLRDIKGNFRKFSTQSFRCGNCNEKYARPPLNGKCKCGGKLLQTVSEGAIRKYLEPTKQLIENYKMSTYLRQQIDILEANIESLFGKKDRQLNLFKFNP